MGSTPTPTPNPGRGFAGRGRGGPGRGAGNRRSGQGRRRGGGGGRGSGGQTRSPGSSKQDAAIAASFPPGYDLDRAKALKIPAGGNQTPKLAIMFDTVGVLTKSTGLAGAAYAADELMTGQRHTFVPVAETEDNCYRIPQDFLVPVGPADYFVPVDDPGAAEPPTETAGDAEAADDKDTDATDDEAGGGGTPTATGAGPTGPLRARMSAARDRKPPADFPFKRPAAIAPSSTAPLAPSGARRVRPMTPDEVAQLGLYRPMTTAERLTAPPFKEMTPAMAKTHVMPSQMHRFEQASKREARDRGDYEDACRKIFGQVLALLPPSAVDSMKARADWAATDTNKDLVGLRSAAFAAVSNSDARLYLPLQAVRSARSAFGIRMRRNETIHGFHDRCDTAFHAHNEAGHGWPVDAHYHEVVAKLATDPTVDRSGWAGPDEPDEATAARVYDACISAFQSVVFLEGLTEAYKEYNDRCENNYAEGTDIYAKTVPAAKERAARFQPAAQPPAYGAYADDPVAMAFLSKDGPRGHSLQGDIPLVNADGSRTCFRCGLVGHESRDCPHKAAIAAGTFDRSQHATTNTTTTTAGPAPAPAPSPAPAPPAPAPQPGVPAWNGGVPLSVTLSAAPAPPPAPGSSVVSGITNTLRGTTGGRRVISNSEILDLLSSTQDNGDGTSTILFLSVGQVDRDSAANDGSDLDAASAPATDPAEGIPSPGAEDPRSGTDNNRSATGGPGTEDPRSGTFAHRSEPGGADAEDPNPAAGIPGLGAEDPRSGTDDNRSETGGPGAEDPRSGTSAHRSEPGGTGAEDPRSGPAATSQATAADAARPTSGAASPTVGNTEGGAAPRSATAGATEDTNTPTGGPSTVFHGMLGGYGSDASSADAPADTPADAPADTSDPAPPADASPAEAPNNAETTPLGDHEAPDPPTVSTPTVHYDPRREPDPGDDDTVQLFLAGTCDSAAPPTD